MEYGKFTYPFRYNPSPEVREAADDIIRHIDSSPELKTAFSEGKMLGVLVVQAEDIPDKSYPAAAVSDSRWNAEVYKDTGKVLPLHSLASSCGRYHYLAAFSGLAGGRSTVEGFVPPVFDLTVPDGHFKRGEAEINAINSRIAEAIEATVAGRMPGNSTATPEIQALKIKRKYLSDELQKWIFRQYKVLNGLGEEKSIADIFADCGLVPPGGTGECAAPKLLQFAFLHGLRPVAMGEFWYEAGNDTREKAGSYFDTTADEDSNAHSCPAGKEGQVDDTAKKDGHAASIAGRISSHKRCGQFYPSCSSKCGPLLRWMLKGLNVDNPYGFDDSHVPEILWEDEYLMAVNKPAGMLCTPGKDGQKCLLERLPQPVYSVHRLDMDTSGILVVAKTLRVQKELHRQFENREVSKSYLAILENHSGLRPGDCGIVDLPMRPDIDDRPRQIIDYVYGKPAITGYEVLDTFCSIDDIVFPGHRPEESHAYTVEATGNTIHRSSTTETAGNTVGRNATAGTAGDTVGRNATSRITMDNIIAAEKFDTATAQFALTRFRPLTGRTHQIRVHASAPQGLGCPIAGDLLYGGQYFRRMYLHAESITIRHPMTGEMLDFSIPAATNKTDIEY